MLRLNLRQRSALGETTREFANLAAAALGLGQVVKDQPLSWAMVVIAVGVWVGLMAFAMFLIGGDE